MRYELVSFARNWRFSVPATLTIACGVGGTVAVFAIVSALWLRPIPIEGTERIVTVHVPVGAQSSEREVLNAVRLGLAQPLTELPVFETVVFEGTDWELQPLLQPSIVLADVNRMLTVAAVSLNYFEGLGIPLLGRDWRGLSGRDPSDSVVVSSEVWRSLGSTPDRLGSMFLAAPQSVSIIGVAPPGFQGVRYGTKIDVWIPLHAVPRYLEAAAPGAGAFVPVSVFARMKPGVSLEQAQLQVRQVHRTGVVRRLRDVAQRVRSDASLERQVGLLRLLLFAAGLVVLVGCSNLASLWLAKTTAERQDNAIRFVLGCSSVRIAGRVLIHVCVLGLVGTVSGMLVGWTVLRVVSTQVLPTGLSLRDLNPSLDWRVAAAAVTASMAAAVISSLGPLVDSRQVRIAWILTSTAHTPSRSSLGVHRVLVAAHTALTMALLVVAAHLSWIVLSAVWSDRGFEDQSTAFLTIRPRLSPDGRSRLAYQDFQSLLERLNALPGVEASDFGVPPINGGSAAGTRVSTDGLEQVLPVVRLRGGAQYGKALGLRVLQGRLFEPRDSGQTGAEPIVIDAAFASRLWKTGELVGRLVTLDHRPSIVIGVVEPVYLRPRVGPPTYLALGLGFTQSQVERSGSIPMIVGMHPGVVPSSTAIEAAAVTVLRDSASVSVTTGDELTRFAVSGEHFGAMMFATFGLTAAFLSLTGAAGLVLLGIERSSRSIAIREALGAPQSSLLICQLRPTVLPVAAGLVVGAALAAWLGQILNHTVPGYGAVHPSAYLVTAGTYLLAVSAALAPVVLSGRRLTPAHLFSQLK